MNNDYLRNIAQDLKKAGVSTITPEQLEDLSYFLEVEQFTMQMQEMHDDDTNWED